MKLCYVTGYDARSVKHWSGSGFYIAKALSNQGFDLCYAGPLRDPLYSIWHKGKAVIFRKFFDKGYHFYREPSLLASYARQIEAKLRVSKADVVFCPGTTTISRLECDQPIVIWTDSAFGALHDFYPGHAHMTRRTLRDGRAAEQLALSKSRLVLFASQWAADFALCNYDVAPEKVKVVPFGANVEHDFTFETIGDVIKSRSERECKLLFLGVDWVRKGGEAAVQVAKRLNARGLKTTLTIAGCNAPRKEPLPPYVTSIGFVSKGNESGRNRLRDLFCESHFLILPSIAECFGLVLTEANSFGVPCMATNVGGIPTIIRDNKNGFMFPLSTFVEKCSDAIEIAMSNRQMYRDLAYSSFQEYKSRLNWEVSGRAVKEYILECCI